MNMVDVLIAHTRCALNVVSKLLNALNAENILVNKNLNINKILLCVGSK